MKIFFIGKYPSAITTYKVLRWLVRSFTKTEFEFYVNEIFKEKENKKDQLQQTGKKVTHHLSKFIIY